MIGQYILASNGIPLQFMRICPTLAVLLIASLTACSTQGSIKGDRSASTYAPIVFLAWNSGPISFNGRTGADFYFSQDGDFSPGNISQGAIDNHLRSANLQIGFGYYGEQVDICLVKLPSAEVKSNPSGFESLCLAGATSDAHQPGQLLVFSGAIWRDGITRLGNDANSLRIDPMRGYRAAVEINELVFPFSSTDLAHFKGTLFGYILVYPCFVWRDFTKGAPIRLHFE